MPGLQHSGNPNADPSNTASHILSEYIKGVNSKDSNLLKYLPDELLDDAQVRGARIARLEQEKHILEKIGVGSIDLKVGKPVQQSQIDEIDMQIQKSEILYLDPNKKRTNRWLQGLRLQLPSDTTSYGSVGSITYPNGFVKMEGVMYSDLVNGNTNTMHSRREDSTGNILTSEQQAYFANSKVRDEQGRLMPMYHGTPNGNYDRFRSGTYFTPNKENADVYQSPNASSISVKKSADTPTTHQVYLNMVKPFDTGYQAC